MDNRAPYCQSVAVQYFWGRMKFSTGTVVLISDEDIDDEVRR